MYVENYMSKDLITITPDTTVIKALDLMRIKDIHRLPVVDDKGKLLGLVTEGIIAEYSPSKATSLSVHELNYLLNKTSAHDMMITDVITARPDMLLEEAAVIMRKNNIGVLLVLDGDDLVGIITDKDIFDAFIDLLGYYLPGLRVEIEVTEDVSGYFEGVSDVLYEAGWNMTQFSYQREVDPKRVVVHLEEGPTEEEVKNKLEEAGYPVILVKTKTAKKDY